MGGTYEDLTVWQRAMDFVIDIYRVTEGFPKTETYGLTGQLRRAAVSVPSNIAEGKGRSSTKELLHFLSNARGSIYEIQTQVILAQRLGYVDEFQAARLSRCAAELGRLMNGLMKAHRSPDAWREA